MWLPEGAWERIEDAGQVIPDGEEVVLAFDGSYNNDATGLVVVRPGEPLNWDPNDPEHADLDEAERDRLWNEHNAGLRMPHLDVVRLWERPKDAPPDWVVPILEVEATIRAACRRWQVREIVCDPARWARSYQILEAEGLPVVEFPQSPKRMVPATGQFFEAVMNRRMTQSGHPGLARHIANAVLKATTGGRMIYKESKGSPRKIDLAVAGIMGLNRATVPPEPAPTPQFFSWADL